MEIFIPFIELKNSNLGSRIFPVGFMIKNILHYPYASYMSCPTHPLGFVELTMSHEELNGEFSWIRRQILGFHKRGNSLITWLNDDISLRVCYYIHKYLLNLWYMYIRLYLSVHIVTCTCTRRTTFRQRPKYMHATIENVLEEMFSTWSAPCLGLDNGLMYTHFFPSGGGVEYLHRIPASRRRRRKAKSRIWESKIWSRVQRDSDPRITALAKASSNCPRQTHPLDRETAPHQQTRSGLTVIKIWS
jgi:hypothetical protein